MKIHLVPPVNRGGLYEQFQQTATALQKQGAEIVFGTADRAAPDDIVHIFDAPDIFGALEQFLHARARHAHVVVSPIYWNPTRFLHEGLAGVDEPSGDAAELERAVRTAHRQAEQAARRVLFCFADALLPQTVREATLLTHDFGAARARMVITPNGIDPLFTQTYSAEKFYQQHGVRDFVLCAARMDALKNQLRLIQALHQETLTLVLIGKAESDAYAAQCRQAASDARARILFIPALPREELVYAYAAARVYALVSWYDVAPIAALEAAAMGCNIALTQESGGSDYFGHDAWYCDPGDIGSIRNAVRAAYDAPRTNILRERIVRECTWERAAEHTRRGYELALTHPQTFGADYLPAVEQALAEFAALAALQTKIRAQIWQEKEMLAHTVEDYANGRVMRSLNKLHSIFKR